jgi:hypothetical protein
MRCFIVNSGDLKYWRLSRSSNRLLIRSAAPHESAAYGVKCHRQARGRSFACLETYKMLKLIRTISQDHRIDCPGLGETRQLGFDAIFVYM